MEALEAIRAELTGYVTRLVVRPDVAEDVVQQTAVRVLEASSRPAARGAVRAWLFKIATNLALDHLRRHGTWRETALLDLREQAEADPAVIAESVALRGSPETREIAREHLDACVACTLRNLGPDRAAALLLREVYGFTVDESAELLELRPSQVKNALQSARAALTARYAESCALVSQRGVCHQCVELDGFFEANAGDPLASSRADVDARLEIVRQRRTAAWGPWHRRIFALVDVTARSR